MSKNADKENDKTNEDGLPDDQVWRYVEEFSALYKAERKKRELLEAANTELEKLRKQLEQENIYLREESKNEFDFSKITGNSPALKKVLEQIELVSRTDTSILIQGETGTGKELIARAIHERSKRNKRALIKVNCAAVPRELFESEFFGHLKGAFTGAIKDRMGRFQLADEGTLLLDEVSEISLDLQGKLLRVLQEGQFERVGDDRTRQVDVRIIATTNRDLMDEVRRGRFRKDLFYRLSVIPIQVPPLRERNGDVELLANSIMDAACRRFSLKRTALTKENIRQLTSYDWPGNIRELQNVIERAIIISTDGKLRFDLSASEAAPPLETIPTNEPLPDAGALDKDSHKNPEREKILATLKKTNWKIYGPRGAAEILQIKPTTLASRMKKLAIQRPR